MENEREAYIWAEVYDCINILGEEYISKIPEDVYKSIEENRSLDYVSKYNEEEGITDDTFSKDAINVIAAMDLEYWCSEEEKKEKNELYSKNLEKKEAEAREKYNPDNVFKKPEKVETVNTIEVEEVTIDYDNQSMDMVVSSDNIFKKIKNVISEFINKLIHRN